MTAVNHQNNFSTNLTTQTLAGVTTTPIDVLPSVAAPFYLALDATNINGHYEVVYVTSKTATNVNHAATTYDHSIYEEVQMVVTASEFDEMSYRIGVKNLVPGTPTRVSDTQFTVSDPSNLLKLDLLFSKGTLITWDEGGTYQAGMTISSSYGANVVTVNIVGNSLTAGFTTMQYNAQKCDRETFIIPGNLGTGTDLAKTWYAPCACFVVSADARVKTAGTTNSTVFDINDDAATLFTTKPTITTGTTSDIDNASDMAEIAAGSAITVDIDSVSSTVPVDAYIDIFWYPSNYRYIA